MNWIMFFDVIYRLLTKREQAVLRDIRREYEKVVTDLVGQVGIIYSKLGKSGTISYADIVSYREIKRLQQLATAQANRLGKHNRTVITKLLEESYNLSYSWMSFGIENAIDKKLIDSTPSLPKLLTIAGENPVYGIRLDASLEASREKIVNDINRSIKVALANGATFDEMTDSIKQVFTMDYNRAATIAETESHRVREKASNDSAQNADNQGIEIEKVWVNMGDERVRKTRKADHRTLHGQRRKLNEPFNLKGGVRTQMPGHSGTPYNDIRCRCIARYEVVGVKKVGVADGQAMLMKQFDQWKKEDR